MKNLIVIGAGGHAKTVISVAQALNHPIQGILDQSRIKNESILNTPIIGEISSYLRYIQKHQFFVAVGDNVARMKHFQAIQNKSGQFISLVHPDAKIDDSVSIGLGSVVAQSAIICPHVHIRDNVIVNSRALIEHDCEIDSHVHIGPDASLAGKVKVQEGAFIGLRAIIKDGVQIGKWARVGAGAVVVSDVPDGATVVGNPAKILSIKNLPTQAQAPTPIFLSGLSVREALEKMDFHGVGHGIVVQENDQALGVITDGLIRRYILANGQIDAPIDNVMNKNFFSLSPDREDEATYHFSSSISFIPILDTNKKLLRVIERSNPLSTPAQQPQDVAQQVKQIFQWLSHRKHQHYGEDHFIKFLTTAFEKAPSAYHMSAETLLESLISDYKDVYVSTALKQYWPSLTLPQSSAKSSKQELFLQHIGESQQEISGNTLWIGGRLPPKDFSYPYLMRCSFNDSFNLEGAGLLFNYTSALSITSQIHPMQIAIGLPQLKNLGART